MNKTREIKEELTKRMQSISIESLQAMAERYRIKGIYHYSFMNAFLIALQGGTLVQSYKKWQELGRQVKKGEKAKIAIWRPFRVAAKALPAEAGQETETENPQDEIRFALVNVFDIEQTDGKPLEYAAEVKEPLNINFDGLKALAKKSGVDVIEKFTGETHGYYDSGNKVIALSNILNEGEKTRTLLHELAHHFTWNDAEREAKEFEAELTVYMVISATGQAETWRNESAGYLKSWNAGETRADYWKCLKAASKIIKHLEN